MQPIKSNHLGAVIEIHKTSILMSDSIIYQTILKSLSNKFLIAQLRSSKDLSSEQHKHSQVNEKIYFLYPGQAGQLKTISGDGFVIGFPSDFFAQYSSVAPLLMMQGAFSPQKVRQFILTEQGNEIERLVSLMHQQYNSGSSYRDEINLALLKVLFSALSKKIVIADAQTGPSAADVELVTRFLDMIQGNFLTMKKVSDYAGKLCITANYLSSKVRAVTGFPARHHIQQRIVMEAKQQAEKGTVTLKEVAYMLGFDDLSHFSKFFKNITGTNFTNFKRSATPVLN